MKRIPTGVRNEILSDPFYDKCVRHNEGTCRGRITWEHALIYQGRQVQEKFAIIPLCEFHHGVNSYQDGGDLQKDFGQWIALCRATEKDFAKYSKSDWKQKKILLDKKYANIGIYEINRKRDSNSDIVISYI